ncbi:MAG: DUF4325 domain-containing protein [Cyclobacteriaceae bacterium]|nr:DUF4325 domain-containing protein [Cyclobacteriaceae bacterium]
MKTKLLVTDIIAKSSAILHSDGLILFKKLVSEGNNEIVLSFQGIEHCTTAFLNASIGNFVLGSPSKFGQLELEGTNDDLNAKITMVVENAIDQKKNDSYLRLTKSYVNA